MNTTTLRRILGSAALGLAIVAGSAQALADGPNPTGDHPPDGPPQTRGPGNGHREGRGPKDHVPQTPQEMRERIERRLEMVRGEEARLQRALERIDEGASPEDVYAMLREGPGRGPGDGPRPDRGPGGRGPEGGPFGEGEADVPEQFAPEMAPRVMRFLEERDPEMFRRLQEARDRNPERFNTILRERWPKIREKILKAIDERAHQGVNAGEIRMLDRQTRELADKAAQASGEERERILGELRTALNAQFDLHADNARREITMLQDRIASLTERLESILANRAQEIENRIAGLLEDKGPAPERGPSDPPPADDPGPTPPPPPGH